MRGLFLVLFLAGCLMQAPAQDYQVQRTQIGQVESVSRFPRSQPVRMRNTLLYSHINYYQAPQWETLRHEPIRLSTQELSTGYATNRVAAFDLQQGREVWQLFLDSPVMQPIQDGRLFFVVTVKSIYCIDGPSGRVLWQRSTADGSLTPSITLSRSLMVKDFNQDDGFDSYLRSLRKKNSFMALLPGSRRVLFSDQNDSLFITDYQGTLITSQMADGGSDLVHMSPGKYGFFVQYENRKLVFLDENLEEKAFVYLPGNLINSYTPLDYGDRVLIFGRDGYYVWYKYKQEFQFLRGPTKVSRYLYNDDQYVLVGNDDYLFCLSTTDFTVIWSAQPNLQHVTIGPFSSDLLMKMTFIDRIVVDGQDQFLIKSGDGFYVLEAETGVLVDEFSGPKSDMDDTLAMLSTMNGACAPFFEEESQSWYFYDSVVLETYPMNVKTKRVADYLYVLRPRDEDRPITESRY